MPAVEVPRSVVAASKMEAFMVVESICLNVPKKLVEAIINTAGCFKNRVAFSKKRRNEGQDEKGTRMGSYD